MNFPLIRAQPDQSVISLSIKPLENSDPLIYSFNPNTHFIYNPHKLLPVITPPQRHFVEHMESNNQSFRQFSDHLRLHNNDFASLSLNDSIWSVNHGFGSKRPAERRNFDIRVGGGLSQSNNPTTHDHNPEFNAFNDGWRIGSGLDSGAQNSVNDGFNKGTHSKPIHMSQYYKNNNNLNSGVKGYNGNFQPNYSIGKFEDNHYHNNNNFHGGKNKKKEGKKESNKGNKDENSKKIFKTLPPAEALPRNETIGGYIFVCNNDTMEENLKRQLFGLPPRFRDSVRAITPGLPLFLYNYSTHQLHGIFEAASFGGSNIDSSAWEDKKHHGESRFPAQVRVQTRKLCEALDEDEFRPILHHYDGPKFRLELSVPEVLSLLDVFGKDKARA